MAPMQERPGATDEWYTPPYIFAALGWPIFDMDVASPGGHVVPWILARNILTANSLEMPWEGFVWMNSPFGGRNGLVPWLEKFFAHRNGICLVPDRTSAAWWQNFAPCADLTLFINRKVAFIGENSQPGMAPQHGTCLMSVGDAGNAALRHAKVAHLGYLSRAA